MRTIAQITKISARYKSCITTLIPLFIFGASSIQVVSAQIPDSGLPAEAKWKDLQFSDTLPEFTIRDVRFERTGYSFWKADSIPSNGVNSLSDRLLWSNALDVRANAPSTLATISIRGAGSSRTPVFWNGLNLQSPMNGVVDVSLLPLWPDDLVEIHYGGQSAAQSSGAMGGSVVVAQGQQPSAAGFSGFLNGARGSFGRWEGSAGAGFADKKRSAKIRASWFQADNNFPFQKQGLDGNFFTARQVNNFAERIDIQQFNQLRFKGSNILKTAFWLQKAFRELPPTTTEAPSNTWQRDEAHRAIVSWEHAPCSRSLWSTRVAWLDDFLAFHLAGDIDTSRSRQALLSTEGSSTMGKNLAWRIGGTVIRQWAQVDGYSDSTRWFGQTRMAGYVMCEWHKGGARISALLRQEWAEAQAAPFTGSLGAQFEMGRVGEARFHFSRNFNLPTLNDRFWKDLGKPDLRSEKGYSADLGWALHRPRFSLELSGFQLILDDWILWQPDSTGLFRPDNLRKVWSRGIESSSSWQLAGTKSQDRWKVDISSRLQISQTTNVAVYGGSESVLGKQLPYTPRVSGGLSVRVSGGAFSAAFLQQFTGERFDNAGKKIQAYQTANLLISCALWKGRITVDFRLENLWNAQYEIIRYRPMPGRSWRLGVGYKW